MRALKRNEGINVVPLIDIVLVLLAIVLTISTFVASGAIKLDLPKAASAASTPPPSVEIAFKEQGELYWNGTGVTRSELTARIRTLTPDAKVSVLGDKEAFFNDFVTILNTLKLQKIEKISIVAKREP